MSKAATNDTDNSPLQTSSKEGTRLKVATKVREDTNLNELAVKE